MGAPVAEQHVSVPAPRLRVAHRVHEQTEPAEAEILPVEAVRERDHLDVDGGIVDAQHLDADLPVLAVAALLRTLVAKVGGDVPDLPRRDGLVLRERTRHRRGAVGAQREVTATLVVEVVHLLADDVGGRAQLLHDLDVLEDGGDEHPESGAPRSRREGGDERLPPLGLGREHVVGADRRAKDVSVAGHARSS